MALLSQNTVVDHWGSFPQGMNAGIEPQLLQNDQLANLTNGTVRGSFVTNRPAFRRLEISYGDVFDGTGLVQGTCYYQPDYGTETIVAAIGGRLLAFSPGTLTVAVEDITQGVFMDATVAQNWLWQSENYIINNDGYSTPRIFDGTLTRLANVETPIATIATGFGIPDVGQYATADLTAPYTGPVNIRVRISSGTTEYGNFEIVPPGTTGAGYTIQLTNNNDTGMTEPVGAAVQIVNSYTGKCAVSAVLSIASKKQIQLDTAFTGVVGDSVSFNALNMTVGGSVHVTEPVTAISADLMTITVHYKSNYPVQILTGAVVSKGNGGPPTVLGTLSGGFSGQSVGSTFTTYLSAQYTGPSQNVTINGYSYTIAQATSAGGTTIALYNLTGTVNVPDGAIIYSIPEIPPGRMGAYIQGRNWIAMPDGLSYIATDQVGDSSGTSALYYRDAILQVTENTLLSYGGSFRVPGNSGQISFMVDLATLDASLGQGPVQVGTPRKVFSCAAPTIQDRAQWIQVTNPIQTESLVNNGGLSQESAIVVNGDLMFRALDGLRSLVLARREFATWGNTVQSNEVRDMLASDDQSLLPQSIACAFDNRFILGINPVSGPCGVYWQDAVVINFDQVSSLRGKAPSVWEGKWTGLNAIKFVTGQFSGVERCFAFCYNPDTELVELLEILKSKSDKTPNRTAYDYLDDGLTPITVEAELPIMLAAAKGEKRIKGPNDLCRLSDGEIYVKDLLTDVTFTVFWRPDYDTEWHWWTSWTVKKGATYQPRMGFGMPPDECDPATGRPCNVFYSCQIKIIMQGHGVIMGGRVTADVMPTQTFAPIYEPLGVEEETPGPNPYSPIGPDVITIDGEPLTIDGNPVTIN